MLFESLQFVMREKVVRQDIVFLWILIRKTKMELTEAFMIQNMTVYAV